ncbi:orotidine-5'-phosphate decarboxylase [Legionella sp. CNM-4043-24]|uniref:orotidine-5'-phosphate decarboxylase n=1 Tax=Legionella sp. CNM-4043-24 TaxID=3421646 RepID=UPI00403ABEEB
MTSRLIIALDFNHETDALRLVEQLDPRRCALKIGSEMFTLFGRDFVRKLVGQGFSVFLDLKFHDIPNTVAQSCIAAADLGVWMMNVHASGGANMMSAARKALDSFGNERPLLIAVTVLTSMSAAELPQLGVNGSLEHQVERLTRLAHESGLDGVVCSAHEVPAVKALCGSSFLTVTPGIRLPGDRLDDQSRVVTPEQAVRLGSDCLVVGRPITRAAQARPVVEVILQSMLLK